LLSILPPPMKFGYRGYVNYHDGSMTEQDKKFKSFFKEKKDELL